MQRYKNSTEFIRQSVKQILKDDHVRDEDTLVVVAGNYGPQQGASFIEISTTENLKNY